MTIKYLSPPDMSEKSIASYNVSWLEKDYEFSFQNNIRSGEIILSIKTFDDDGNEINIVKNITLVINIDLMDFTKSDYWQGRLYLMNISGSVEPPTSLDVNNDFVLILVTEDEYE